MRIRNGVITAMAACLAVGCSQPTEVEYDIVIRGGTVFDGSGSPGVAADIGIRGDRIVAIGDVAGAASRTIDASGLYVSPGFIDMHSHSETFRMLNGGQGPSFAYQGFTTEIYGETVSMGPLGGRRENDLPDALLGKWESFGGFLDYMEDVGISINVASYVGSGGIRANVMGYEDRPPTDAELAQMLELVRQSMREGAMGVSAGMSYVPNIYMSTDELAAVVRASAEMGGIFANHARTMNGTDPEAISEAIVIGELADAPIHFFHLNSTSSTEADTFLGLIDKARARGLKITGDSYTYTWGITGLRSYIPAWAQEGGVDAMLERLRDPAERERIAGDFVTEPPYLANIGWHHVRFGVDDPEVNGKLVSEVASLTERAPEEVFMDVVLDQEGRGIVIDWNNEEDTLRQVLSQPYVAGGTDGSALDLDSENLPPLVHPRHIGTVPRLLGTYVRDAGLLTWEEAIRKLTSLPADILGLRDRGILETGNIADIVIFDPATIQDNASFEDPFHYPTGMRYVLVNGTPVVDDGAYTGALPGRAIRGPAFVAGATASTAAATPIETLSPGVLKVAITRDTFDNEYDSQLWIQRYVERFAEDHELRIDWLVVPFNESWLLAGGDQVDLVATNVASFADRESEGGTFSQAFLFERRALRIDPEDQDRFSHINDFIGHTVGVVNGMAAQRDVDRRAPEGVNIYRAETFAELYAEYDAGNLDAIAEAEYYSLDGEVIPSHGDDIVLIDHHDLNPGQREESVFVVRDKSANLLEAINTFIDRTRFPLQ